MSAGFRRSHLSLGPMFIDSSFYMKFKTVKCCKFNAELSKKLSIHFKTYMKFESTLYNLQPEECFTCKEQVTGESLRESHPMERHTPEYHLCGGTAEPGSFYVTLVTSLFLDILN